RHALGMGHRPKNGVEVEHRGYRGKHEGSNKALLRLPPHVLIVAENHGIVERSDLLDISWRGLGHLLTEGLQSFDGVCFRIGTQSRGCHLRLGANASNDTGRLITHNKPPGQISTRLSRGFSSHGMQPASNSSQ